jgi:hypothetical protein
VSANKNLFLFALPIVTALFLSSYKIVVATEVNVDGSGELRNESAAPAPSA